MLSRLIIAVVVGVVVYLACVLLGALLTSMGVTFATTVGEFLEKYAGLLGLLAGLWSFFSNWNPRSLK